MFVFVCVCVCVCVCMCMRAHACVCVSPFKYVSWALLDVEYFELSQLEVGVGEGNQCFKESP